MELYYTDYKFKLFSKKYSQGYNKEIDGLIFTRDGLIDLDISESPEDFYIQRRDFRGITTLSRHLSFKRYFISKSLDKSIENLDILGINKEDKVYQLLTDEFNFNKNLRSTYFTELNNFIRFIDYMNNQLDLKLESINDLILIKRKQPGTYLFNVDKFKPGPVLSYESKQTILSAQWDMEKLYKFIKLWNDNIFIFNSIPDNKYLLINIKEKLYGEAFIGD